MDSIVGVFPSVGQAHQALNELIEHGFAAESLILLSNQNPSRDDGVMTASSANLESVPTKGGQQAENREAGKSMGTALGGALGATTGFTVAATVASLMVPGVGVVYAIGMGAAALLGLGGAAAGAKVGDVLEHSGTVGIQKERVGHYQELLRQGKSTVVANVDRDDRAATAREVFQRHGSEDDAALARRDMPEVA